MADHSPYHIYNNNISIEAKKFEKQLWKEKKRKMKREWKKCDYGF